MDEGDVMRNRFFLSRIGGICRADFIMVSNIPKIISNLKQIVSGNFLISTEDKGLYITAGASTTSSNACFRSVGAARFRSRHHHSMRKITDTIVMLSDMPGVCNRFLPVDRLLHLVIPSIICENAMVEF